MGRSELAVVAAGGALGSAARYGVGLLLPADPAVGFPWATLTVNTVGCLLMGALVVAVTEVWAARPLVRPFLGVGVLGGFTTFSTFAADTHALFGRGATGVGLAYLGVTVVAALAAVAAGSAIARRAARR